MDRKARVPVQTYPKQAMSVRYDSILGPLGKNKTKQTNKQKNQGEFSKSQIHEKETWIFSDHTPLQKQATSAQPCKVYRVSLLDK